MENKVVLPDQFLSITLYSSLFLLDSLCRFSMDGFDPSICVNDLGVSLITYAIDLADFILAEVMVSFPGRIIQVTDLLVNP